MVAHECNIFVVSGQLIIISILFVLCREEEICCESFIEPYSWPHRQHCICLDRYVVSMLISCGLCCWHKRCIQTQMRSATYKLVFAQELLWPSCEDVLEEDWALGLIQKLMICEGEKNHVQNWILHLNHGASKQILKDISLTLNNNGSKHMQVIQMHGSWLFMNECRMFHEFLLLTIKR